VLAASELMTDNVEPKPYKITEGGGVRNARKTNGNVSCLRVCVLNSISVSPAINIGSVIAWYSSAKNVLDPYQYNNMAIVQRRMPLNVSKYFVHLSCSDASKEMTALNIFLLR
jgi:hypothetical protein